MSNCCSPKTYTPHEQKIFAKQQGNTDYKKNRERIYRILERFQGTKPKLDIDRGRYFTESMKTSEDKSLVLRWAMAMKHIAENIPVYIQEDELIVGRGGKYARYGILYPELYGNVMESVLHDAATRVESSFDFDEEEVRIMKEEIAPYWRDKAFFTDLTATLPEATRNLLYDPVNPSASRNIINETDSLRASLQWVPDYAKAINIGFDQMKKDAEIRLEKMKETEPSEKNKIEFLQAIILECEAIILYAARHADKATELAQMEQNEVRKQELLDIAVRCRQVPAYPARNFAEAIQAQWFTAMFSRLEIKTGAVVSNGRMDQYLYPYYKQDIENGTLTELQAQELLENLWVNMAQFTELCIGDTASKVYEGYAHWEAVTVGGQNRDGLDATNDLTYLMLRSKREFPIDYPDLAARIHSMSPERYLHEVALTIKEGSGYPKLFNDEEIILNLVAQGAPIEDAYDYAASGCSEARMPNIETYTTGSPDINTVSAVEMTLYNGRTFVTGDELLGLETGTPEELDTWEKFFAAFEAQMNYLMEHSYIEVMTSLHLRPKHFVAPLNSCLHDLCMKYCEDLLSLEIQQKPEAVNIGFFDFLGYATTADSLAAVKKLVYDEKIITLPELVTVLRNNFEDNEVLRQRMIHAPKYGNNDPYADEIAKEVDAIFSRFLKKASEQAGFPINIRMVPITAHVAFGKTTGATPNGRKAYFSLSDGSSASHGSDINGPTAVLLSNYKTKARSQYKGHAARLLNVKFTPGCLDGGYKKISILH